MILSVRMSATGWDEIASSDPDGGVLAVAVE